jgi:HPt (histidine-containing phosphotransfer) domain-containing protein
MQDDPGFHPGFSGWATQPERTEMAPSDDAGRPLVDPSVLDRLRDELADDEGYCTVFVSNFIDYLPVRIGKLRVALTTGDLPGAVDAVLSIKTSSQMVGAERLAGLAIDLERSIREDSPRKEPSVSLPQLAADYLRPIGLCCSQTLHRLESQRSAGAKR